MTASVLAFLQARVGSTRLPGKVLLKIAGRSILDRAVWRLRSARTLDDVIVLTTTLPEDDAVAEEAEALGAPVFRGPAADVLRRFQLASEKFSPSIVVRATADNPLVDFGSADRIVEAVRNRSLEYCMEAGLPLGAATEAITAAALARADVEATLAQHREHVTLYVKQHPERFRIALLAPPEILRHPEMRITVDTPQDFIFVEELILRLAEGPQPVALEHYVGLAGTISSRR